MEPISPSHDSLRQGRRAAPAARERARFRPAPGLGGFHRQTLASAMLRLDKLRPDPAHETRWVSVDARNRLRLRLGWARPGPAPTLLLAHGLGGSSRSTYMLGVARQALRAGVHVARLDLRGAGGTEAHAEWLGHAGLAADGDAVVRALLAEPRVQRLTLAGFSLGGNLLLRTAALWGDAIPDGVAGLVVVSAAADLARCQRALDHEPRLRVYRQFFLWRLHRFVRQHARVHGPRPFTDAALRSRTLRDYDAAAVCPVYGFRDPDDYYDRASAVRDLHRLRLPTLALHAADDHMVPCGPRLEELARELPALSVELEEHGGHCGFWGLPPGDGAGTRFWAETRVARAAAGEWPPAAGA